MDPKKVNPRNFEVDEILFNNGEFSIAYGTWEEGHKCLAMRWNGEGDDPGYPKVFGNPMWFIIADDLKEPFIQSLLYLPDADIQAIKKIL